MQNDMRNFSISSYSFHGLFATGSMNLNGFLESARYRYQVDNVDIWNMHLPSYEADVLALLRLNLRERGVSVANLCCDMAAVWADDVQERAQNEKTAWQCLQAAEVLGAKTVRFDAGIPTLTYTEAQLDYVATKFSEYARRCAEFGARVGPENHWGASTDIEFLRALFRAVPESNFGLLLHLGNWQTVSTAEEKDACDRAMIPSAMHTHLDFEHCLDADRVFPPLVEAGYSGVWSVESHKGSNEYNNVAVQLAQLRRVLAPMAYTFQW